MPIQEGPRDQRRCVVPQRRVGEALAAPVTRRLVVTAAGYHPRAVGHLIRRLSGADETVVVVSVAGIGWAEVDGVRHRVGAGSALVIPSRYPHGYGASGSSPWTIWWCHLRGTDVPELVAAMGASAARPVVPIRRLERAVALIDEIVSGLERDQSPARLVSTSSAAWRLLTQIIVDRVLPERGDPLERAMSYLAERLDRTVPVPDLAAQVGVSPSHLSALFRRATGGGVLAHHTALRMAEARRLLEGTSATVAEIARAVGYRDPFYFSRHFRRLHEASPTEYRNRHKA